MNIGRTIYGYCNGFFGRDDYDEKIIILEGRNWIVCRYVDVERVTCANFNTTEEKQQYIDDWAKEPEDN